MTKIVTSFKLKKGKLGVKRGKYLLHIFLYLVKIYEIRLKQVSIDKIGVRTVNLSAQPSEVRILPSPKLYI